MSSRVELSWNHEVEKTWLMEKQKNKACCQRTESEGLQLLQVDRQLQRRSLTLTAATGQSRGQAGGRGAQERILTQTQTQNAVYTWSHPTTDTGGDGGVPVFVSQQLEPPPAASGGAERGGWRAATSCHRRRSRWFPPSSAACVPAWPTRPGGGASVIVSAATPTPPPETAAGAHQLAACRGHNFRIHPFINYKETKQTPNCDNHCVQWTVTRIPFSVCVFSAKTFSEQETSNSSGVLPPSSQATTIYRSSRPF